MCMITFLDYFAMKITFENINYLLSLKVAYFLEDNIYLFFFNFWTSNSLVPSFSSKCCKNLIKTLNISNWNLNYNMTSRTPTYFFCFKWTFFQQILPFYLEDTLYIIMFAFFPWIYNDILNLNKQEKQQLISF